MPRLERRRAAAQNVKRPSRPGARGADRGHGARGPHALREGLEQLRPFTKAEAEALLNAIAPFQEQCRRELGTTFAFPSDEFFCIAGRPIPPESWYEDFPQIENGVGLLRRFECELEEAERFEVPDGPRLRAAI